MLRAAKGQGMRRYWCWKFKGYRVRFLLVPTSAVSIDAMYTKAGERVVVRA